MKPSTLTPAVLLIILLGALASSACGIVATPYTVPHLIAVNGEIAIDGQVVNDGGLPLCRVTVVMQKKSRHWMPLTVEGTGVHDETVILKGSSFSIHRYGYFEVDATFSKPGYADRRYSFFDGPYVHYQSGIFVEARSVFGEVVNLKTSGPVKVVLHVAAGTMPAQTIP